MANIKVTRIQYTVAKEHATPLLLGLGAATT
jgi:hypothetical protein